jgi:hypothetical protein
MQLVQRGLDGETRHASTGIGEGLGVLAAILSSSIGGTNTAVTRYVIGATDPVTLAGMRFGLGFLLLLPIALALKSRWPKGRDWLGVALLGILFFATRSCSPQRFASRSTTYGRVRSSHGRALWDSSPPAWERARVSYACSP